jgi:hypothetical protein
MSTQTGFFDNLVSAIRENPLAATLIGGGALWLVAGNEKLKDVASSATSALVDGARNARAAASELQRTTAPPTAPEMDHDGAFRVGEGLHRAAGAAADLASRTADKVKDRLNEGSANASAKIANLGDAMPGKEAFTKAQSSLADILDRQPLVLGAVGMAIGAAVAGAFRTSGLEREWLGDASDDARANLATRASAASQSVREASDTLSAQMSDMAVEVAERLKHTGMDAADAARDKLQY